MTRRAPARRAACSGQRLGPGHTSCELWAFCRERTGPDAVWSPRRRRSSQTRRGAAASAVRTNGTGRQRRQQACPALALGRLVINSLFCLSLVCLFVRLLFVRLTWRATGRRRQHLRRHGRQHLREFWVGERLTPAPSLFWLICQIQMLSSIWPTRQKRITGLRSGRVLIADMNRASLRLAMLCSGWAAPSRCPYQTHRRGGFFLRRIGLFD